MRERSDRLAKAEELMRKNDLVAQNAGSRDTAGAPAYRDA